MKQQPVFTPIDLAGWRRREMFYYFSEMAPTGYSLTSRLDVTVLKRVLKNEGLRLFPAYLWLVTKALSRQEEFKIAQRDGVLGVYNCLTPLYASFHEEDKTFSLMWTEFDDQFPDFYADYIRNQQAFGDNRGVLCQKGVLPPPNAYTVSCLPWVDFDHFAVHSYNNSAYYFPSVESGKITEQSGRLIMPISLTCHHAATDGWHIKVFLEELQEYMNGFCRFL